ncbi:MAG TPA: imidazole glycerol phosphate synthase subunit HisH [Microscillaceae bacterium]|nr:imidazole glycerol phosphate synthase subunit HisH [Microscillaceae bacterium]
MKLPTDNTHSSPDVVIIDYNLNNLFSVKHACQHVGINARISADKNDIAKADALILPGVGAFGNAMQNLEKLDLIAPIIDSIQAQKPFLGICLGLQLLFEESDEFGHYKGLGVIPGQVQRFPGQTDTQQSLKVPFIGWNEVHTTSGKNWNNTPMMNTQDGEYMYFVHSNFVKPTAPEDILCVTKYKDFEYCSGIVKNNIFAVQFHPEKSAQKGLEIYQNWGKSIQVQVS